MINYVLCHKDFEWKEKDKPVWGNWRVISQKDGIKCNIGDVIKYESKYDDRMFGELGPWKYIETQMNSTDFAGMHHYRRKISYYEDHICVVPPLYFNVSIGQQLAMAHSVKCYEALAQVVGNEVLDRLNIFYPYNLFCVNKDALHDWLNFVEPRLMDCCAKLGYIDGKGDIKPYEEILDMVKNDETFCGEVQYDKNISPVYQARTPACLCERLNTIFWVMNTGKYYFSEKPKLLEDNMVM